MKQENHRPFTEISLWNAKNSCSSTTRHMTERCRLSDERLSAPPDVTRQWHDGRPSAAFEPPTRPDGTRVRHLRTDRDRQQHLDGLRAQISSTGSPVVSERMYTGPRELAGTFARGRAFQDPDDSKGGSRGK